MPRTKQTPGTALCAMLKKFNLNYNRLAKSIGMSSAMIRLIARDENPISAPVAFRLAKFFKTTPEYWLALQTGFDISKTAADKELAKGLTAIQTADTVVFTRKKKAKTAPAAKSKKPAAKKRIAGKPRAARSRIVKNKKPAAKNARAKKISVKKPGVKKPAKRRLVTAKTGTKRGPKKAPKINEPRI